MITSKLIEDGWRSLLERTVPPETDEGDLKTMKRFFYAGAKTLLDKLTYSDVLDENCEVSTKDDVNRVDAIMHECNAFFAEVGAGRQ